MRFGLLFEWVVAIAGAAATIASDALMNPFDGKYPTLLNIEDLNELNPQTIFISL